MDQLKEHIMMEIKSEFDMSDDEKNKLRDMIKLSFYDDIIELKDDGCYYRKDKNKN